VEAPNLDVLAHQVGADRIRIAEKVGRRKLPQRRVGLGVFGAEPRAAVPRHAGGAKADDIAGWAEVYRLDLAAKKDRRIAIELHGRAGYVESRRSPRESKGLLGNHRRPLLLRRRSWRLLRLIADGL